MKNVHLVMEALGKASKLPHERLLGAAPPGQADESCQKCYRPFKSRTTENEEARRRRRMEARHPPRKNHQQTARSHGVVVSGSR